MYMCGPSGVGYRSLEQLIKLKGSVYSVFVCIIIPLYRLHVKMIRLVEAE